MSLPWFAALLAFYLGSLARAEPARPPAPADAQGPQRPPAGDQVPRDSQQPGSSGEPKKIHITGKQFELDGKSSRFVWKGGVTALREDMTLRCDELTGAYDKDQRITHLWCKGDVEVTQGDRWAAGEAADFDNLAGLLVVTGKPRGRQGPNRFTGDRVTFEVEKDRWKVENARMVFESAKQLPKGAASSR